MLKYVTYRYFDDKLGNKLEFDLADERNRDNSP